MKKGSIKLTVLYPNEAGKTFNMEYYSNNHVALLGKLLGDAVIGATIENGLGGGAPNSTAPFVAIGNLYFNDMESFENSFGPNAAEIMADLPNYTNIEPTVQISEVVI